ncbi:putative Zinc finger CCHC-type and RNA-binding motif-containing protein, partial [Naja naja]
QAKIEEEQQSSIQNAGEASTSDSRRPASKKMHILVMRKNLVTDMNTMRNYYDKSKCYECGEIGHLSYACPKNMLGEREPPKKKDKKKRKKVMEQEEIEEEESEDEGEDPALDSLSQAIAFQQAKIEEEQQSSIQNAGEASTSDSRRPHQKSAYFSDEEELSD